MNTHFEMNARAEWNIDEVIWDDDDGLPTGESYTNDE